MIASPVARKTFLFDSLQVFVRGILDTGPKTFFLLIAVRHFQASELIKSLLAAPVFMGMIFSLFAFRWLSRSSLPLPTLSALIRGVVGVGFLVSALVDNTMYYTVTVVITCLFLPVNISLQTAIYKENYPQNIRGRLFGWSMVLNLLGSILFHWIIGIILDNNISHYRYVLVLYGGGCRFIGCIYFQDSQTRF